jgi:hypothetical protein
MIAAHDATTTPTAVRNAAKLKETKWGNLSGTAQYRLER